MGDERYDPRRDGRSYADRAYNRDEDRYAAQDYGVGRSDNDARGYRAQERDGYGARDYGHDRYRHREAQDRGGRGYYQGIDNDRQERGDRSDQRRGQPEDRGFISRAGDEVRSWFGDEEAERRREADARYDDRAQGGRDDHYQSWRRGQMEALDRDYEEYRHENRTKFENEFSAWRTERQGQRSALSKVAEHMEVLGSDGVHVGTVDKVRGDRILLTRNDPDAGGHHHSIPSRWIAAVEDKVTLAKTAAEAKRQWQEEDEARAMFGDHARHAERGPDRRY